MSKYSETCGCNEYCGGRKIVPLTVGEAMGWCEKHLTCDEFEAEFGKVEE